MEIGTCGNQSDFCKFAAFQRLCSQGIFQEMMGSWWYWQMGGYRFGKLVIWCFEPSQPQRIASGLNTNFTLSPSYSLHKSLHHKSCFLACLYSAGTQHRNLHLAGWPFLFCGPKQEPCVSHSQHRKNREKFSKNAGEWAGRVDISKEEIPGSKLSMCGCVLTYSRL